MIEENRKYGNTNVCLINKQIKKRNMENGRKDVRIITNNVFNTFSDDRIKNICEKYR